MKDIEIKSVTGYATVSTSGYSDRYVMVYEWKAIIKIGDGEIKLSTFSLDRDLIDQIEALAEFSGIFTDETSVQQKIDFLCEKRRQVHSKTKVLIRYRDGNMSSECETNSHKLGMVIGYFSSIPKLNDIGMDNAKKMLDKTSREELLGIKQQMDSINALIKAGLQRAEIVEFNWNDK